MQMYCETMSTAQPRYMGPLGLSQCKLARRLLPARSLSLSSAGWPLALAGPLLPGDFDVTELPRETSSQAVSAPDSAVERTSQPSSLEPAFDPSSRGETPVGFGDAGTEVRSAARARVIVVVRVD